jgi:hypothetical protein
VELAPTLGVNVPVAAFKGTIQWNVNSPKVNSLDVQLGEFLYKWQASM